MIIKKKIIFQRWMKFSSICSLQMYRCKMYIQKN